METTTVKVTAKVANVTSENIANDENIVTALQANSMFGRKSGEVGIRTFGFIYAVVALTEHTAKDMVDTFGVDKGQIAKAKKVISTIITDVIGAETITPETYQEAIEYAVATWSSLCDAYSEIMGTKSRETSLADMVKNVYKWAEKNGHSVEDVMAEVARQGMGE